MIADPNTVLIIERIGVTRLELHDAVADGHGRFGKIGAIRDQRFVQRGATIGSRSIAPLQQCIMVARRGRNAAAIDPIERVHISVVRRKRRWRIAVRLQRLTGLLMFFVARKERSATKRKARLNQQTLPARAKE